MLVLLRPFLTLRRRLTPVAPSPAGCLSASSKGGEPSSFTDGFRSEGIFAAVDAPRDSAEDAREMVRSLRLNSRLGGGLKHWLASLSPRGGGGGEDGQSTFLAAEGWRRRTEKRQVVKCYL